MTRYLLIPLFLITLNLLGQFPLQPNGNQSLITGLEDATGIERLELVGGYGERTDNFRFMAHWEILTRSKKHFDLELSLAANYSLFDGEKDENGDTTRIRDLGLTPTFTFFSKRSYGGFRPFMDAGIGFHYLTDKHFTTKDFSTNFQFGDHIGLGVQFGESHNMRVAYQFQHLSNAGIGSPNPGINFHLLNFGIKLGGKTQR